MHNWNCPWGIGRFAPMKAQKNASSKQESATLTPRVAGQHYPYDTAGNTLQIVLTGKIKLLSDGCECEWRRQCAIGDSVRWWVNETEQRSSVVSQEDAKNRVKGTSATRSEQQMASRRTGGELGCGLGPDRLWCALARVSEQMRKRSGDEWSERERWVHSAHVCRKQQRGAQWSDCCCTSPPSPGKKPHARAFETRRVRRSCGGASAGSWKLQAGALLAARVATLWHNSPRKRRLWVYSVQYSVSVHYMPFTTRCRRMTLTWLRSEAARLLISLLLCAPDSE